MNPILILIFDCMLIELTPLAQTIPNLLRSNGNLNNKFKHSNEMSLHHRNLSLDSIASTGIDSEADLDLSFLDGSTIFPESPFQGSKDAPKISKLEESPFGARMMGQEPNAVQLQQMPFKAYLLAPPTPEAFPTPPVDDPFFGADESSNVSKGSGIGMLDLDMLTLGSPTVQPDWRSVVYPTDLAIESLLHMDVFKDHVKYQLNSAGEQGSPPPLLNPQDLFSPINEDCGSVSGSPQTGFLDPFFDVSPFEGLGSPAFDSEDGSSSPLSSYNSDYLCPPSSPVLSGGRPRSLSTSRHHPGAPSSPLSRQPYPLSPKARSGNGHQGPMRGRSSTIGALGMPSSPLASSSRSIAPMPSPLFSSPQHQIYDQMDNLLLPAQQELTSQDAFLMSPASQTIPNNSTFGAFRDIPPTLLNPKTSPSPNSPGKKVFHCHLCPTTFSRNHDLKRHIRIHLGIRPYRCQTCPKAFTRADALHRHVHIRGCRGLDEEDD